MSTEKQYLELSAEDEEQIETMQHFFDIPYDVALERYLQGNYNGEELTDEDIAYIATLSDEEQRLIVRSV